MLDTLYKTNNTKCLQLLLKYRKGKLESIVCGVEYYKILYAVMAYAMMSLIQIQPMWR